MGIAISDERPMVGQLDTSPTALAQRLRLTASELAHFCQRWHIKELGLFGSVIRTDFRADSDIDVLVVVEPQQPFNSLQAQAELSDLVGRKVDLTQKRLLTNPFSRCEILRTYRVLYPPEAANFTALAQEDKAMTDQARNNAALLDMVKAMQTIQRFLVGRGFDDLINDELFQSAVERQLEILGEAANRVTEDFQAEYDDIDWSNVIGLRHVIIHQYDDIDYALLWEIVTEQVPLLLAQVEPLVPPLPEE
ncbi:MAG: HepT-like ribonuclease domain-containing protein [Cyanobacteria bacterium P01_D01_bin.14]